MGPAIRVLVIGESQCPDRHGKQTPTTRPLQVPRADGRFGGRPSRASIVFELDTP